MPLIPDSYICHRCGDKIPDSDWLYHVNTCTGKHLEPIKIVLSPPLPLPSQRKPAAKYLLIVGSGSRLIRSEVAPDYITVEGVEYSYVGTSNGTAHYILSSSDLLLIPVISSPQEQSPLWP